MNEIKRNLSIQADVAAVLVAQYSEVVRDEDEIKTNLIQGETDLIEAIGAAVARIREVEALIAGIEDHERQIKARKDRLKHQAEMLRAAVGVAMQTAELDRAETPVATVARKNVPPRAIVTEEADLPAQFWTPQPPKLDKRKLLAALKEGAVPGASLSNGGQTIQITGA